MEPPPEVVSQIVARASSPGYDDWWSRVEHAGFCSSPVELRGRDASGRPVTILARCKNRRAAVCPSCSALYSGDTWQLVHRGIAADDSEDNGRPMVFVTLTAPGFGAVHSTSRSGDPCRPGPAARCEHGRSLRCTLIHEASDLRLGEPLCPECYDYFGHVLFTWHAPQLWHRFTVALRRLVQQRAADAVLSYVKVVELQRRGVPHFHAVIRLDDTTALSAADLAALIHRAAASLRLDVLSFGGELVTLRFGSQTDVQPLRITPGEDDDRRVASYLAKYVTKSVADFGLSPRRLSPRAVANLDVRPHVRAILETVLELADSPGPEEMTRWLHTLGYRGHITTKTRAYSTTMGALRAHRAQWRVANGKRVEDERPAPAIRWRFVQVGHRNKGDRLLATTADVAARISRLAAREELACRPDDGLGL
ncbi:replication initiator [Nocardioides sp. J54]|uniref:replication initiator n=1 Tax=Nocardioides sp. J54 TaxID=935866 RepID=UPI0004BC0F31